MAFLLTIIALLLVALTFILAGMLGHFIRMSRRGKTVAGVVFKKSDIEDLLFAGNAASARDAASAWLRASPKNPAAYLLLAKANFQLGELIKARRTLEDLVEFSPESEFHAKPYRERISKLLAERKPRAVE